MKKSGNITVVYGNQRGDEGKGRFVDLLAKEHPIVARFGGGQNAGHTVVVGDKVLKLSLVPSGIAYDHTTNVVGNGTAIDPIKLVDEIGRVVDLGFRVDADNFMISNAAHLVMPHHIEQDEIREAGKGKQGSTKSGIAQVYGDKHLRTGFQIGSALNEKASLLKYAEQKLDEAAKARKELNLEEKDYKDILDRFSKSLDEIDEYITDTSLFLNQRLEAGDNILAEGAQAFWLDIDHGMYPFTTSSATSATGVPQGLGVPAKYISKVVGVTKLTQSHVGGGPFVTEIQDDEESSILRGDKTKVDGEYGTVTGRPRRMGYLDLPAIKRSQMVNGDTEMAVTKLDLVPKYGDEIKICTKYLDSNGKEMAVSPTGASSLEECEPAYETLPSWKEDISDIRDFSDLPENAQKYIELLEKETNLPISMIGVGPGREQVIIR